MSPLCWWHGKGRSNRRENAKCDSYELTISLKKTVVCQPAPGKPYKKPTITVKGQRLQVVDAFTYLVVHIDDEVNARTAKASAAFSRLRGRIWNRSGIRLDTKLKVYRSVVLPSLLYACETWTVYQRHDKRLNHFHTSCLRKLLVAKQDSRHRSPEKCRDAECIYSSESATVKMDRPCYQNAWWTLAKENPLCRTTSWKPLPWWSEEALQGNPQMLP